jgi:propionate CoA-transferase (EC 2.8.3.1)
MNKVRDVKDAVQLIKDGDTVAISGFVGCCHPEGLTAAIEKRFLDTGKPTNLTIVGSAGQGDGKDRGLNHFAHVGLTKRLVEAHWNLLPKVGKLVIENKLEGYTLPQGVMSQLYREIARGSPGLISHVGLGTVADPRMKGGKLNDITKEDLVEVIELAGREWLLYKAFPINVSLLRGTTADADGNISMEKEGMRLEMLPMAEAAKNSGGIVIAQVERISQVGHLKPMDVVVPGILVDCIVVASPEEHMQTFVEQYNPSFSGEVLVPMEAIKPLPLGVNKIVGRRGAMEFTPEVIVNIGIGSFPEAVPNVAAEENISDLFTLTVEAGPVGGIPQGGLNFGSSANPVAIIDQPYMFDFYDGGGLDLTFMGLAQCDRFGNVNVSKFGPRIAGIGGFTNITTNAQKIVFCGTFTAGGLKEEIKDGRLSIIEEGKIKKFIKDVEHVTFNAKYARKANHNVVYVTERCVLTLGQNGPIVKEIAPGINLEKDILSQMEFKPEIADDLHEMDSRIFREGKMNLRDEILSKK